MVGKNDGRRRVKICPTSQSELPTTGTAQSDITWQTAFHQAAARPSKTRSTPMSVDVVVRRQKPERFRGNGTSPGHSLQEKITFLHEIFTSATAEVVLPSLQLLNWCSTRQSEGRVKVPQDWGARRIGKHCSKPIDKRWTGKIESAVTWD